MSNFGYFKKLEKSQSKFAVAEEIGCGIDMRQKKTIPKKKCSWVDGSNSRFKDCLQQSKIRCYNYC